MAKVQLRAVWGQWTYAELDDGGTVDGGEAVSIEYL